MSDPIEGVLNELRGKESIRRTHFSKKLLHSAGEILEREGFATTRLFLLEKQEENAARVLLEDVLPILAKCERIQQNRAIGRYILKALPTLQRGGNR